MVNYFKTLYKLNPYRRYRLRRAVSKYLNEIMRDDMDSHLYVPDVSKFLITILTEGMFLKLSLAKQHMVIELYRENRELALCELDKKLNEMGDKENLEAFWGMVKEYKPEPKQPDNKKRKGQFLYLFGD